MALSCAILVFCTLLCTVSVLWEQFAGRHWHVLAGVPDPDINDIFGKGSAQTGKPSGADPKGTKASSKAAEADGSGGSANSGKTSAALQSSRDSSNSSKQIGAGTSGVSGNSGKSDKASDSQMPKDSGPTSNSTSTRSGEYTTNMY